MGRGPLPSWQEGSTYQGYRRFTRSGAIPQRREKHVKGYCQKGGKKRVFKLPRDRNRGGSAKKGIRKSIFRKN